MRANILYGVVRARDGRGPTYRSVAVKGTNNNTICLLNTLLHEQSDCTGGGRSYTQYGAHY